MDNSGIEDETMKAMIQAGFEAEMAGEEVYGTRTEYVYKTDNTGYKKEKEYNIVHIQASSMYGFLLNINI